MSSGPRDCKKKLNAGGKDPFPIHLDFDGLPTLFAMIWGRMFPNNKINCINFIYFNRLFVPTASTASHSYHVVRRIPDLDRVQ